MLAETIGPKLRHDLLHKLMRALAAHGVPLAGAITVCRLVNRNRCSPPLVVDDELGKFLTRAYYQQDRADFVRTPKTGFLLGGCLLEMGLDVEAALIAIKSLDPLFDGSVSDAEFA